VRPFNGGTQEVAPWIAFLFDKKYIEVAK